MDDYLIETLERSVEKNGEKPLTNKWLLNLLRSAKRKQDREEFRGYLEGCRAEMDL
jgi:hypothetical protein